MAATATTQRASNGWGWGWALLGGIVTVGAGLFMLVYPEWASMAVTLFAGWALMLAGFASVVAGIANRRAGGMWTSIILGLLALVAGAFLAFNLLAGTVTLTMVFVCWLIADGGAGIVLSLARREANWGWWFASSVVTLALGLLLLGAMPGASAAIIGIYAGIVLIVRGMTLAFLSLDLRHARPA